MARHRKASAKAHIKKAKHRKGHGRKRSHKTMVKA